MENSKRWSPVNEANRLAVGALLPSGLLLPGAGDTFRGFHAFVTSDAGNGHSQRRLDELFALPARKLVQPRYPPSAGQSSLARAHRLDRRSAASPRLRPVTLRNPLRHRVGIAASGSGDLRGILIVADSGADMFVTGTMDRCWNNDELNPAFYRLTSDDFEVIELGWR